MPQDQPLIIPFGTADPVKAMEVAARDDRLGNIVTINTDAQEPLRLHHGPYDFRATPRLGTASDTETRLTLLHDHLHALCDLWQKAQHGFIDAYFGLINATLECEQTTLTAALANYGGLYHYRDWAFSALRPLPRAQIPLENGSFVSMDFAFWTGSGLVAINLKGVQTLTKAVRNQLTTLKQNGIAIIDVESASLANGGASYLETLLPAPFHHFWKGDVLPQSPFKPTIVDSAEGGVRF